jgi:HD-GYP domain-containing protein (c-di-GMP phosphodiesterase class II)
MHTTGLDMVPTRDLKIGMYVSRLDRPWTDTPFLFQGFFIHRQDELQMLRRYCHYVFVDQERTREGEGHSAIAEARRVERTFTPVTAAHETPPASPRRRRRHESYPIPLAMEEEIGEARLVYDEAREVAKALVVKLMDEGRVEMEPIKAAVQSMLESILRNPDALIWLSRLRAHDAYVYHHALDCCIWGLAFGRHLGLQQEALYEIGLGCLLFDIGKTKVPHQILIKQDMLTEAEQALVRSHVEEGLALLDAARGVPLRVREALRTHHERFDGSGYPAGLRGEEIPTEGKIAGMVDCYDALVSFRPNATPLSPDAAMRRIFTWRGSLFQSEVVEQFMQVVGVFPTGSLVELNTRAVGMVIGQNERRLRPRIVLMLDEERQPFPSRHVVDLWHDKPWSEPKEFWIERCLPPGAYGLTAPEL